MTTEELRSWILWHVEAHERAKPGVYVDDTVLAEWTGASVDDVQRQIRILGSQGLLQVIETFGPKYGVLLTPEGELALDQAGDPPKPKIGF